MFVKAFFLVPLGSRRVLGLLRDGHDRDGPLAVEGRLLSGHEVSRAERGSRGGRQIGSRPAPGAAAGMRASPPREAAGRRRGRWGGRGGGELVGADGGGVQGDAWGKKRDGRGEAGGGSPAVEGRLLSGREVSRAERGSRGGRQIGSRPAPGAAAGMRARPPREAVRRRRGAGGRPHARRTASGSG